MTKMLHNKKRSPDVTSWKRESSIIAVKTKLRNRGFCIVKSVPKKLSQFCPMDIAFVLLTPSKVDHQGKKTLAHAQIQKSIIGLSLAVPHTTRSVGTKNRYPNTVLSKQTATYSNWSHFLVLQSTFQWLAWLPRVISNPGCFDIRRMWRGIQQTLRQWFGLFPPRLELCPGERLWQVQVGWHDFTALT